jgi:SNF2 family DNA or RNA helicase
MQAVNVKASVARNLTVATHIFLIDSWWNPTAEM